MQGKEKALEVLKEKVKELFRYNTITIVNDYDIDSCSSASILWRVLESNGVKVEHITLSKGFESIVAEKIKEKTLK